VSKLAWPDTPTWSPDGRQIAFAGDYKRSSTAIYAVSADGSGLARLTSPRAAHDAAPAWSPDGTQIVFERDRFYAGLGFPVIVMNADGTSQRVLSPKTLDAVAPVWSPDGLQITFSAGPGFRSGDIYVMNRDGSAQENLTRTKSPHDDAPLFSPSGRTIVFQSVTNGPGKSEIHLINAAGTRHLNLTRNRAADHSPAWTSDGRILFVSSRDGNGDIYVMTTTGASVTNLTNTPTEAGFNRRPKWSPTP
jgi:TolB protein